MTSQQKEKITKLTKYLDQCSARLSDPTPAKHANRPQEFRDFLAREIKKTKVAIEGLRGL